MRGLYFDGKLQYREDIPMPKMEKDESLIKILYAGICNTDKEILKGYKKFTGILGHEFVGIVEDSTDKNLIGKRIVGEINIGCHQCEFCKEGLYNHCYDRKILGMTGKDGVFADYITLPNNNIHIVPEGVSDLEAVFAEPLSAALEITEMFHIKPKHRVAIIGDGKLGQLIAQVLSLTACDLTIIGKHLQKLNLVKDKGKVVLIDELKINKYFDVVVDCTGNEQGLIVAGEIVKPRGTIILKSTYNSNTVLNPTYWVVNEINILGSRCGPMDAALRIMERKLFSADGLIDEICSLKDYEKAFDRKAGKVIFDLKMD
ncbi:MDR/zinc-dependent alcohol dehydrogenase-like family protein [Tepidimicrobium xylanilyticum]